MLQPAAQENKPFEEKYQARDKLLKLISQIKTEWEESLVIRCFKALLLHRLGTNYYDAEEISMGEKQMQESALVWRFLPLGLQMNYANCIQDVLNVIAIVRASREDSKEALKFLEESLRVYNQAIKLCRSPSQSADYDPQLSPVDRFLLRPASVDVDTFDRRIYGGINVKVLEQNLTQTYFYLAQVYQQDNQVEKGIEYCCLTMQRQVQSKQFEIKDLSRNCMSLAEYFTNSDQFAQAEYLLYAAIKLVPNS